MWFLSSYVDRCAGVRLVTPNCQRGLTLWIGKFTFVCAWSKDVGRGFDLSWSDNEPFFTWNF